MKAVCDDCEAFSYAPKKDLAKTGWRFLKVTDLEGIDRTKTLCPKHNAFLRLVLFLEVHLKR